MNDPAEIPTDLSSDELAERLEGALEGAGWILGQNAETPHVAQLYYRPRTRSPSYDLAGMASFDEPDIIEAVAREHGGRIALLTDLFIEWRGGKETIWLARNGAGHYHETSWQAIRERDVAAPPELPAEFLEALRADPPDGDRMLTSLSDHLYGEPTDLEASADVALVEAYHPFDARWREALEPLFLEIRSRLAAAAAGHEIEVPGLAIFRRLDSDRGVFEAVHRPRQSLRDFFVERTPLSIDLDGFLGQPADPGLARALEEACARSRDDRVDVLVGADLVLHTVTVPGYEGKNPRTDEPVLVPPKTLPIFIGW
jgi:hypothetical protein